MYYLIINNQIIIIFFFIQALQTKSIITNLKNSYLDSIINEEVNKDCKIINILIVIIIFDYYIPIIYIISLLVHTMNYVLHSSYLNLNDSVL